MPELTEWLFHKSVALRIPLSVHIDLTMRCNERCIHCYRVVEQRPELTTAELKTLLDDVARAGTLYLTFSGGEVFLRKDLFELVEHARRLHFDVRLKSNALLITPAMAARLRELGVRQVDISIYSPEPAVHDWVTKVPGSLERSLAGAAMLRDAGVTVKLNCPLMKQNVGQYKEIRALAERLGLRCGFDPMITAKNDGDRSPVALRISGKELRTVLQDPMLNPCGNVRDEPFAEIWHRSPEMLRVRAIRIRDLHTCSSCAASQFCSRCPGQALIENGDLYGPSPANCEQALVGAQTAGSAVIPASMLRPPRSAVMSTVDHVAD